MSFLFIIYWANDSCGKRRHGSPHWLGSSKSQGSMELPYFNLIPSSPPKIKGLHPHLNRPRGQHKQGQDHPMTNRLPKAKSFSAVRSSANKLSDFPWHIVRLKNFNNCPFGVPAILHIDFNVRHSKVRPKKLTLEFDQQLWAKRFFTCNVLLVQTQLFVFTKRCWKV